MVTSWYGTKSSGGVSDNKDKLGKMHEILGELLVKYATIEYKDDVCLNKYGVKAEKF